MSEPSAQASRELDTVRAEVRSILERSPAYRVLEDDQKRHFANSMVKIGDFLAHEDGAWIDDERSPARARALADDDAVGQLKQRLARAPGQVGADFRAGAVREGTAAFRELVDAVDFPDFVSDLIQGVFQAIVDASIQQMEAYGEMLAAVAKSVDQFATDEISDAQARDYVRNRYPSVVVVDTSAETAKLRPNEDTDTEVDLGREFNMNVSVDLDDEESEQALVNSAKLEMARSRQQLLATMVLLGIHRIVVTNGRINARVVFDVVASDEASRRAQASMHDERSSERIAHGAAFTPWGGGGAFTRRKHRTTVKSSVDDRSESSAEAKAQLSGDVRVNFRSDTVPLERMVDSLDLQVLTSKSQPPQRMQNQSPDQGRNQRQRATP